MAALATLALIESLVPRESLVPHRFRIFDPAPISYAQSPKATP